MTKYTIIKNTKAFETIASSAGFDPAKFIILNKGEIIEGKIQTVPTGYAPRTALFFTKNEKPYSISPTLVEEFSINSNIGKNTKASTSIFTAKNIIGASVVFGLIFGGLKLAKVI